MVKIISWNIQQGGGTRVEAIAQAIIIQKAEIVILSEYQNNAAGNLIRIRLMLDGYIFQSPSTANKEKNGVLIAAKTMCSFHPIMNADDEYNECVLQCNWNDLTIYGVYLPHKKKHTRFDYLINELKNKNTHSIIAGDFNSGFNRIDQAGDSFWYEDKLRALLTLGMLDAFRLKHQEVKEYSWYSHQGNGYRYDHTWITRDLQGQINRCTYSHDERVNKITDHSMMILELDH